MSAIGLLLGLMSALAASPAAAHVERPSYWPDPKPDTAVTPSAGGAVPTVRTLGSALDASKPGDTRVVCKTDSLNRVKASIAKAKTDGYDIRPTDHRSFSDAEAKSLLAVNTQLFAKCKYTEIQPAVTASHNNDRVVVMPGLYEEPTARAKPTNDSACDQYKTSADSGDPGALSHDYQLHCPNDANLIAVIGRGPDTGAVPSPPLENRHGIPNPGPCIRCNVQLEGSGVSADDVVVEVGDKSAGNGGPSAVGHAKHVGIFVDRADGFVLRNVTVRHANEHDIYILETDGYVLDRFKTYYAGGYGVLTFVEDHGVVQNCEAAGNGDSGLYPGSGADSTANRYKPFYPDYRYSQVFRWCDSHHNTGGFSGTNSHGTLITENNFYDNSLGFTTDVFTAPGHPGFPQFGNVIEKNNFYSNNLNVFTEDSDVEPFIPAPVGTGLWLAGGNDNIVRNNRFYDNWRRGTMLFAVPDATVCGPSPIGSDTPVPGCNPLGLSTSYRNSQYDNIMGVAPDGKVKPNGVDFWWDAFPTTTGNCWWGNKAAPGKKVVTQPLVLPNCVNGTLPATSIGLGDPLNEAELVACLAGFTISGYPAGNGEICNWTTTPEPPSDHSILPILKEEQASIFASICAQGLASRTCTPLLSALTLPTKEILAQLKPPPAPTTATASTEDPLGTYTCSWWRNADDEEQLGMVQRIRAFASGRVDGTKATGYGAAMSDARAIQLLDNRCDTFEAGPYALYKLYGAAAAFSGLSN
ncbi:MAG TPA: right-handed parallel beta-helix repeat-containing protein [Aeromicrobium sp.]|nr:right-handed parallel beta-helix repeat-containing protein [Aeromicrobium sp.]